MFATDFIAWLRELDGFSATDIPKLSEVRAISPSRDNAGELSIALDIPIEIRNPQTFDRRATWGDLTMAVGISGYDHTIIRNRSLALRDAFDRFTGTMGTTEIISAFMT